MLKLVLGCIIQLYSVILIANCQINGQFKANNVYTYVDNHGDIRRSDTGEIVPVRSTYTSQIAFEQYKNRGHLTNAQIEVCRINQLPQNECIERFIPQYSVVAGNPTEVRTGTQKVKPLKPANQYQPSNSPSNPIDFNGARPTSQTNNPSNSFQNFNQGDKQNTQNSQNNNGPLFEEIKQPSQPNLNTNQSQRPAIKPQYNPASSNLPNDQFSSLEQRPTNQNAQIPTYTQSNRPNKIKFTDYAPITKFAWSLFQASHPLPTPESNFVLSGLSPQLLLSYLSTVSEGKTKKEILGAISYPEPNQLDNYINTALKENTNRDLQIASAFFVTREMEKTINQTFLDESSDRSVAIVFVNFKNPVETTKIVDQWIKKKTKEQITSIKSSYAPTMRMLLSSVIYFKGHWFYEFNDAVPGMFRISQGNTKVAEMMSLRKKLKTSTIKIGSSDVRWLELPYKSAGESMILIVPVGSFGLKRIISDMQSEAITNLIDTILMSDDEIFSNVNLTIPRFSISSTASLVEPLKKMGIFDIFTPNSDIPYLSTNENVQISDVQQQSVLEVNEKGSIASSVTTFSVIALSYTPPVPNIAVIIDQPFLAIIVDKNSKVPLFIAEINEP